MDSTRENDEATGTGDPSAVSSTQELAGALTALRHRAGISIRRLGSLTGIPPATLGGYFSGRHLPSVSQGSALEDMLAALGVTEPQEVESWFEAVRRLRARPAASAGPEVAGAPDDRPNPYRGLRPFTEEQADTFFGRESYVEEVLNVLRGQRDDPESSGLVALVAPSGAGKSSLLCSGILPALRRRGAGARVVVPGAHPMVALDATLDTSPATAPAGPDTGPDTGPDSWAGIDVLVVDQLEEVFAPGVTCEGRRAFVDRLAGLAGAAGTSAHTGRRTLVLFGVRADFYGLVLREPVLLPALRRAQVVLGPMTETELRRAIVEPARTVGVTVEDALVELLLRDLAPRGLAAAAHQPGAPQVGAHQPGALPLLSHALMTAWERRRGDQLTVGDYVATGGIAGAVQASAEKAWTALPEHGRAVARSLFSALVNVDEEGLLTRRRLRTDDLRHLDDDEEVLAAVLERFIAARLLTVTDTTVEISHEALLDAWPRLWDWIEADREALRVRRRVASAAALWTEHRQDDSALLRGAPLAGAVELLEREEAEGRHVLTPAERAFVLRSRDREGDELRDQRRRSRRLSQLLVGVSVLAVVAAVLATYALDSRSDARRQRAAATEARDAALSRQVATDAERLMPTLPILAKQLAVVAHDITPTLKARSALLDTSALRDAARFVGPEGSMHASASTDGSVLAFAGADGKVRVWRRDDAGEFSRASVAVGDPMGGLLFASAFSPDRRLLAVGGINGTVRLFDVANPAVPWQLAVLDEPESAVQSLAFSPDGTTLAAATSDPAVHRWDLSGDDVEPLSRLTGFDASVQAVAFAPTDDLMATGSNDATVRLWDVRGPSPRLVAETTAGDPTNFILGVAFSPDGGMLAAGAKDKIVRLYDVSRAGRLERVEGPESKMGSFVNTVAFSADGALLAAGASDGTARVWDVGTRDELTRVPVPGNVTSVAFTEDDRSLLTGSLDGTGRLWSLESRTVGGLGDNVWSLAYDGSGSRLMVGPGTGDGAVHVYDVSPTGAPVPAMTLTVPESAGLLDGAAAMSRDGRLVAGGTATGHVVVWELDGDRSRRVGVLAPSTQLIEAVAFSRDGRLLVSIGDDGAVVVHDTSRLVEGAAAETARVEVGTIPLGVALDPEASLLAVTGADNRVHLWRLDESGAVAEELDSLTGFENYAIGVAFSPDGGLLAVGSSDATVRLWDVSDPGAIGPMGRPVTGPTETVYSVAWHPDGDELAAVSADGSVWLWDVTEPSEPVARAVLTALSGDGYTVAYAPDGARLAAAGSSRSVRIWDTDQEVAEDTVCASAGTPITREEWRRYVHGARFDQPCE